LQKQPVNIIPYSVHTYKCDSKCFYISITLDMKQIY